MKLISHRGNVSFIDMSQENSTSYIQQAIDLGFDVEMDVRKIGEELFLGHDTPDYLVSLDWLLDRKDSLWVHTKNFAALQYLIDKDLRTFYHQKEDHTIINNCNIIWSHNLNEANEKSIIPLLTKNDLNTHHQFKVYGICSDFVGMI